jgi:hypothetical protein
MFLDPKLAGRWQDLLDRLDETDAVSRWGNTQPSMADLTDTNSLLAAWSDTSRTNSVLLGLVHLAAADGHCDDDALLLLLHLLSGLVYRLVGQLSDLSPDITAMVITELTRQILGYRWRTRRGSVVANLRLETRRALLADLRPSDRYHPERVERVTGDGVLPERSEAGGESGVDVVDLLLWAADRGVPAADLALLIATERARDEGIPASDEVVAASRGITRRTLYRRRHRTLSALRELAPEYLRATG